MKRDSVLLGINLLLASTLLAFLGNASADQCRARCSDGSISADYDCNTVPDSSICRGNSSGNGASDSGYDYGAVQRATAARQAQEAAEAERQRVEQQRQEAARRRMQEEAERQAKFIQERDEAASSLKSATGAAAIELKGVSGAETPQLKGSGSDSTPTLKGSVATTSKKACPTVQDSSVIDACNVPSGLPSSVDNAISTVYASAPSAVSDRVRKGFRAVMGHDWKVAKAWFEDALNHAPGNANLKRLVELSDYTEKHVHQGKIGKSPKPSLRRMPVQVPMDSDIELLFPGWQPVQARSPSIPASKMPKDSDIEFLFPGLRESGYRAEAKKLNDLMLDEAIKMTENDPVLLRVSNRPVSKKSSRYTSTDIHN